MTRGASPLDCCFFFQAEDGIRDLYVTGVQTCALPIFGHRLLELEVVDPGRARRPRTVRRHDRGARGACLDSRQHPHLFGDLHRRAEEVDRVPTGLAQAGCPLDDVTSWPDCVSQYARTGPAMLAP